MGDVFNFEPKRTISRIDTCAGCGKEIEANERYYIVTMEHDDYKEQIALCKSCNDYNEQFITFD